MMFDTDRHRASCGAGTDIVAYISALSALAGSVIGSLTSVLYALISRRCAMSSSNIVARSKRILLKTTNAYFEPNRTVPELRELIGSGAAVDPLKDFAEAVREECWEFAHVDAALYGTPRLS